MAITRRDKVGAGILVAVLIVLIVVLYVKSRPVGPAVGYEDNFFVQQRVRIQTQNQNK